MSRFGSLRARLAIGVLLLTALGLVLAATAGTLLLRSYLVHQVEDQLVGVTRFAAGPLPFVLSSSDNGGGGFPPSRAPRFPSQFIVTQLTDGGTVVMQGAGSQVNTASLPDLSGVTLAKVMELHGATFEVPSLDGGSSYLAAAVARTDGTGIVVQSVSLATINDTVRNAALASLAVGLLTLGLVGLLVGIVIRIGLRPLEEVEATAERIAAGDLSQRVPDMPAGTEIGRLSTSLNGMLAQIETAFDERTASEDRLRRFVADASHELRTPLTTIRGYAELSRSGAISADADRRAAVVRIEAEAVRMGVLVDDLLLLARLDQQRPLEHAPVDVVELVDAAAAALRAAAPDRTVTVSVPESVVVAGDGARLRQVVDNLLTNARVHTAEGSPVAVTVTAGATTATVTVTDQGPGMSAEDLAHATERFYRGDPSRTRRNGAGSGLGLSIVQAIVDAHGGSLAVASAPELGTTITVTLPLMVGSTAQPQSSTAPQSTSRAQPSAASPAATFASSGS